VELCQLANEMRVHAAVPQAPLQQLPWLPARSLFLQEIAPHAPLHKKAPALQSSLVCDEASPPMASSEQKLNQRVIERVIQQLQVSVPPLSSTVPPPSSALSCAPCAAERRRERIRPPAQPARLSRICASLAYHPFPFTNLKHDTFLYFLMILCFIGVYIYIYI
jgi:hypothetical protein